MLCEEMSPGGGMTRAKSKRHLCQERMRVPDSGYASAEEYSDGGGHGDWDNDSDCDSGNEEGPLALLRADDLERGFSIKWLTGLVKRADSWVNLRYGDADGVGEIGVTEENMRMAVIDEAYVLLAQFAGDEDGKQQSEPSLMRKFTFPFWLDAIDTSNSQQHGGERMSRKMQTSIIVELNDAPLDAVDHTAVGLQSWASAVVLAQRMCADPAQYLLANQAMMSRMATTVHMPRFIPNPKLIRVLELGAGTGLLSIAAAKVYSQLGCSAYVQATDYHSMVLDNLSKNVHANLGSLGGADKVTMDVAALDWSSPPSLPEEDKYDVILASDVIYDPQHARWIHDCVARLMKREPITSRVGGDRAGASVFWLAIPHRSTGRHEGMGHTVEDVFSSLVEVKEGPWDGERLTIVSREEIGRQHGVGRADEGGYTIFEIRWALLLGAVCQF